MTTNDNYIRVRILEIHSRDGHWDNSSAIIGTTGYFLLDDVSDDSDYPPGDWIMGVYQPDFPLQTIYEGEERSKDFFFFYAVRVEELPDEEN